MAILKKKNEKIYLSSLPVYITDTSANSLYFQIYNIPDEFPAGKTAFKINGSSLLVPGSEVFVEITDVNGDVIYSEYPHFLEGVSRFISVYVYQDTPPGPATITVLGKAINVPNEWSDTYNVKWTRNVLINPFLKNTSQIRFYKTPSLNVKESVYSYQIRNYGASTREITYSSGTMSGIIGTENYLLQLSNGGKFDNRMIGATVTIPNPKVKNLKAGYTASAYSTSIASIENGSLAIANDPYTVFIGTVQESDVSKTFEASNLAYPPTNAYEFTNSNYTMSFYEESSFSESENYRSFAIIDAIDLDTFSGDVYSMKLYVKSVGSVGDYELIADSVLESVELLTTGSTGNSFQQRIGEFINQTIIDNNWVSSSNDSIIPQLQSTSSKLLDALFVSGSPRDYDSHFRIESTKKIPVFGNSEYTFKAKLYATKQRKLLENNDSGISTWPEVAKLRVFMSGSGFSANTIADRTFGKHIATYEITSDVQSYKFGSVEKNFTSNQSGTGSIVFVIDSGDWHISDVSLKVSKETGFSPSHVNLAVPIPDWQRNDTLKFKAEFFDVTGKKSLYTVESDEISFGGGNYYIGGTDNLLSGSLFVGNAIGSGVEIAGVASAYIRSIGYESYLSASRGEHGGGFLIWSGSIFSDHTSEYQSGDVGFELHGGSGSSPGGETHAMRFRTATGKLEITGSIYATDGVFSGSLAIGTFPYFPTDDTLTLHLNFDSNTIDQSGNENDGVPLNSNSNPETRFTPTYRSSSVANRSIDLGGNQYIKILSASIWDASDNFTLTMWVNATGSTPGLFTITNPAFSSGFKVFLNGGTVELYDEDFGGSNITTTATVTSNTWTFLSFNFNKASEELKIYRNAVLVSTTDISTMVWPTDPVNIFIGGSSGSLIGAGGFYDEIRIYKKLIDPKEIQGLYLYPGGNKGTIITGDQIRTGRINSNNWNANNIGSQINLNFGTMHLGGSGSNAQLYFDGSNLFLSGSVYAQAGNIGGWTIDTDKIGEPGNKYLSLNSNSSSLYIYDTLSATSLPVVKVGNFQLSEVTGSTNTILTLQNISSSYSQWLSGSSVSTGSIAFRLNPPLWRAQTKNDVPVVLFSTASYEGDPSVYVYYTASMQRTITGSLVPSGSYLSSMWHMAQAYVNFIANNLVKLNAKTYIIGELSGTEYILATSSLSPTLIDWNDVGLYYSETANASDYYHEFSTVTTIGIVDQSYDNIITRVHAFGTTSGSTSASWPRFLLGDTSITIDKPFIEISQEGLLVYRSPENYILSNVNKFEIKGTDAYISNLSVDNADIGNINSPTVFTERIKFTNGANLSYIDGRLGINQSLQPNYTLSVNSISSVALPGSSVYGQLYFNNAWMKTYLNVWGSTINTVAGIPGGSPQQFGMYIRNGVSGTGIGIFSHIDTGVSGYTRTLVASGAMAEFKCNIEVEQTASITHLNNVDVVRPVISVRENTANQDYLVTVDARKTNNVVSSLYETNIRPLFRVWISTGSNFNRPSAIPSRLAVSMSNGVVLNPTPGRFISSSLNSIVGNTDANIDITLITTNTATAKNHYIYAEIQGKVYKSDAIPLYSVFIP